MEGKREGLKAKRGRTPRNGKTTSEVENSDVNSKKSRNNKEHEKQLKQQPWSRSPRSPWRLMLGRGFLLFMTKGKKATFWHLGFPEMKPDILYRAMPKGSELIIMHLKLMWFDWSSKVSIVEIKSHRKSNDIQQKRRLIVVQKQRKPLRLTSCLSKGEHCAVSSLANLKWQSPRQWAWHLPNGVCGNLNKWILGQITLSIGFMINKDLQEVHRE